MEKRERGGGRERERGGGGERERERERGRVCMLFIWPFWGLLELRERNSPIKLTLSFRKILGEMKGF